MNITVCTEEARKGFYPTPPELAAKLLEGIELDYTNSILEPSAGTGNLIRAFADAVYEKYYHKGSFYRCDLNVDCCEIDAGLRGILSESFSSKAKEAARDALDQFRRANGLESYGTPEYEALSKQETLLRNTNLKIVHDDWMSFETWKPYDLIVMNPPFFDGDAHLLKAISMQERTGGKIRCILNAETILNPCTKRRQALRQKLSELGAEISYEEGAFTDAERKTDVEVAIIKIDIPKPHRESDIFQNCLKAEQAKAAEAAQTLEMVLSDDIKQAVAYYRAEVAAGVELINQYAALKPHIMSSVKNSKYDHPLIKLAVGNDDHATDDPSIEKYCQAVRQKYWEALFMNDNFMQQLTSDLADELRSRVSEMKELEFSEYNIKMLYLELTNRMILGVEEQILALFDKLTAKHSYGQAENGNVHYFNGWKTNKCWKIGKKVILPCYDAFGSYSRSKQDHIDVFNTHRYLVDIEKALNYLDGNMTAEVDLFSRLNWAKKYEQTRKIPCKYFLATFFKKGTCHLEFTCPELIDRFNIYCAQKRGWLPPSYGKKKYQDMDAEEKAVIDSFHGDDSSGSGEKAYSDILAKANYYLAPPNHDTLALPCAAPMED